MQLCTILSRFCLAPWRQQMFLITAYRPSSAVGGLQVSKAQENLL